MQDFHTFPHQLLGIKVLQKLNFDARNKDIKVGVRMEQKGKGRIKNM